MPKSTKVPKPYDGFILQSLPRSGTNFVLDFTNATEKFGHASEYLNNHSHPLEAAKNADDHYRGVMQKAFAGQDRFSIKLFPRQLFECTDHFGYDFLERCRREHNILFIRLRRLDKTAQAVSFFRALQDKDWSTQQTGPKTPIEYDFEEIKSAWLELIRGEAAWDAYNSVNDITPINLLYEDIENNPAAFVQAVGEAFSEPDLELKPRLKLQKQRDDLSASFCERFRAELDIDAHINDLFPVYRNRMITRKAPRTFYNLFALLAQKPLRVRPG